MDILKYENGKLQIHKSDKTIVTLCVLTARRKKQLSLNYDKTKHVMDNLINLLQNKPMCIKYFKHDLIYDNSTITYGDIKFIYCPETHKQAFDDLYADIYFYAGYKLAGLETFKQEHYYYQFAPQCEKLTKDGIYLKYTDGKMCVYKKSKMLSCAYWMTPHIIQNLNAATTLHLLKQLANLLQNLSMCIKLDFPLADDVNTCIDLKYDSETKQMTCNNIIFTYCAYSQKCIFDQYYVDVYFHAGYKLFGLKK